MGLLSNIVKTAYTKVLDPFTTVVSHPIKSIQAAIDPNIKFKDVVASTVAEPKGQQIVEAITTGLTVGSVLGATKAVVTKGVTTAAKALIPSTTKGKVIAAVAAPVAVGVLSETKKPVSAISKAPGALAAFGADVGTFIDDPTLRNAEKILKENPGVTLALGAGAVAAGAGAVVSGIGAIENIKTRESVKDLTKELSTDTKNLPTSSNLPTATPQNIKLVDTNPQLAPTSPPTAQTQQLTTTSKRLPSSRKVKKQNPINVNQRVNVVVQNKNSSVGIKSQNKNYLKRGVYA